MNASDIDIKTKAISRYVFDEIGSSTYINTSHLLRIINNYNEFHFDPGYIQKCKLNNIYTKYDVTPRTVLIHAIINYRPDIVLALIETGKSNPGFQNDDGNTALIFACRHDQINIAHALLETGKSNPGIQNKKGETALMIACIYDRSIDIILAILNTGESNPEAEDKYGSTALMIVNNKIPYNRKMYIVKSVLHSVLAYGRRRYATIAMYYHDYY